MKKQLCYSIIFQDKRQETLLTFLFFFFLCFGNLAWGQVTEETLVEKKERAKSLYQGGIQAYKKYKFEETISLMKQALTLYEEVADQKMVFSVIRVLGVTYSQTGDYENALVALKKNLELSKKQESPDNIVVALTNVGLVYEKKRQFENAKKVYVEGLKYRNLVKKPYYFSALVHNLGSVYFEESNFDKAITCFEEVLQIRKKYGQPHTIARPLQGIASCYQAKGELSKAIDFYRQSLNVQQKKPNYLWMAETFNDLGIVFQQQGDLEKAEKHFQKAIEFYKKIRKLKGLIKTFNNLGVFYEIQGETKKALEQFQCSLKLLEQVEDPLNLGLTFSYLGGAYEQLGSIPLGIKYYQKAIEILKDFGSLEKLSGSLNNLGTLYGKQGNYKKAVECFQKSLKINEKIGNLDYIATSLTNLGAFYERRGKPDKALGYHFRALELRKKSKNSIEISQTLNSLAYVYLQKGFNDRALNLCKEALEISEKVGNDLVTARILVGMGRAHFRLRNIEQAKICFERALALRKELGIQLELADSLISMVTIYQYYDLHSAGVSYLLKAYKIYENAGIQKEIFQNAFNLARIFRSKLGGNPKTSHYFLKGIQVFEKMLPLLGVEREDFIKLHLKNYYEVVDYFISQNGPLAFSLMQQIKAYGFLNQMSEMAHDFELYADPVLIQEKNKLLTQIANLHHKITRLNSKRDGTLLQQLSKKRTQKEKQFEAVLEKIRLGNPAYYNIKYPKAVSLKKVQELLTANEVMLEFFLVPDNLFDGWKGRAYLFLIGKNFLKTVEIGEPKKLEQLVANFRTLLWESRKEDSYPDELYEVGNQLYTQLFQEIEADLNLNQIKHLIIAPDSFLHTLAFEALTLAFEKKEELDDYKSLHYLMDRYTVSYISSATVFAEISHLKPLRENKGMTFLGFGDPSLGSENQDGKSTTRLNFMSLPGSRNELKVIAQYFSKENNKILLGEFASEPQLFLAENLSQYRILHFATHGVIDHENPLRSSLILAQLSPEKRQQFYENLVAKKLNPISCSDGLLQVRDIFKLHQRIFPELVVLSACETGLGKLKQADGIVGLSRAWQFAGAPSVIVSLWAVSDDSTSLLMQHFYQHLFKESTPTLTGKRLLALHQAKKLLRNSKKYASPYYWAPFILRGLK